MTKKITIWREHRILTIKDGMTIEALNAGGYFERHPDAKVTNSRPTDATIEKWSETGTARALDGCKVEEDGTCLHGFPSWLLALKLI